MRGGVAGIIRLTAVTVLVLGGVGCRRTELPPEGPTLATTTTYLEAAARDLLGGRVGIVRLGEPGSCPGHFDLRPSQVAELRRCRALLRFDFQKALDARLVGADPTRLRVAEIAPGGGMCRPDSYLAACRQIAGHLVALDLLTQTDADLRLQSIETRLQTLARDVTNRLVQAGLAGLPVIASGRQRDFCQWLGLNVVAAFRAADTASIADIEQAIDAGQRAHIRLVIANLPEGRRTADALAERLKARVVVFENFPALRQGRVSFDAMVAGNVAALLQAARAESR